MNVGVSENSDLGRFAAVPCRDLGLSITCKYSKISPVSLSNSTIPCQAGGKMLARLIIVTAMIFFALTVTALADNTTSSPPDDNWNITFGPMYLHRDMGENFTLLQDAIAPTVNLSTKDFGHMNTWGGEVALTGDIHGYGVEVRGLFTEPATEKSTLALGPPTLVRINTFVPFFLPGVTSINAKREATFDSLEANISVFSSEHARLFVGGRGLRIDDDLGIRFNTAALPTTLTQKTSNRMMGPQIGLNLTLPQTALPGIKLSASGRLAYLKNRTRSSSVLDTGVVTVTAAGKSKEWTSMAELGLNADWELSSNTSLSLGYNLIYIDKLATPTESLLNSNYFTSAIPSDTESAMFHGASIKARILF